MKSNYIYAAVGLAIGSAIGSMSTFAFLKKRYDDIFEEELKSVKEEFSKRPDFDLSVKKNDSEENTKEEDDSKLSDDIFAKKYARDNFKTSYSDFSKSYSNKNQESHDAYVIPPEEFGEIYDYSKVSLTYWADGVVTDENYDIFEDVDGTIGEESLEHFGEYEDISVYVRNDLAKCDYEILLDTRKYSDFIETRSNLGE